jgi:hypothetical protein
VGDFTGAEEETAFACEGGALLLVIVPHKPPTTEAGLTEWSDV